MRDGSSLNFSLGAVALSLLEMVVVVYYPAVISNYFVVRRKRLKRCFLLPRLAPSPDRDSPLICKKKALLYEAAYDSKIPSYVLLLNTSDRRPLHI